MEKIFAVKHLNIAIKKENRVLVNNISFDIDSGESLVLLGQSGCGKTMTCRAIMNLLPKRKFSCCGKLIFDEVDINNIKEKEKGKLYGDKIVFIPQNPMTAFDPSMRIGKQMDETLVLHSKLTKNERLERIYSVLRTVGLDEVERVYNSFQFGLSGGMLQRVLIAMCLMVNARLIVADEPTTALDVVHRNETVDSFIKLRENGSAVLMVTHDFSAAARFGGNIMIMKDGEIIESGIVDEVIMNPSHEYTKALIQASALSKNNERRKSVCYRQVM